MSNVVETLVEMGFNRERAELACQKTGSKNIEVVTEWLLTHEEESVVDSPVVTSTSSVLSAAPAESCEVAKSIKCNKCNKLFTSHLEVELHGTKTGHDDFSESTEEKKPLTEEEKKEQLARIEAKLKQRRLEREQREKLEEHEREKNRIRTGKEIHEAKKKHDEMEIKKIVEQRKREKEEEQRARQRVRDQIEQDKLARKAKFDFQPQPSVTQVTEQAVSSPVPKAQPTQVQNYTEVKLQIRLTNGDVLKHTFGPKEPLSAVRLFVELNRTDSVGPFSLMTTCPKRVFNIEDYEKPLDLLDLAPSAVVTVSKL